MIKKIFILCSILWIVVFCLSACSDDIITTHYTIFRDSETCYLQSTIDIQQLNTDNGNMIANLETPVFSSIHDMQQRIKTGDIPGEQLSGMLSHLSIRNSSESTDTFEICDPDKLYDVMLPDGLFLDNISWSGTVYLFDIKSDSDLHGFVQYCTTDSYVEKYNNEYINALNETQIILSDGKTDDRNARIVHYKNATGRYKEIYYSVYIPNGVLSVREHYALDYYSNTDRSDISDTVPNFIHIFGVQNGACFYGWFTDFEERPSISWLSNIGLQEYGWIASEDTLDLELQAIDDILLSNDEEQTILYLTGTEEIDLWIPSDIAASNAGLFDGDAVKAAINVQINVTTYETDAEYEKRLANYDPPALTYVNELSYGPEYGPHNMYIDWYEHIGKLPNVKKVFFSAGYEDLRAAYTDDKWCMYQLPDKDTTGSWLVSNLLSKQELENVLRFVDWLFSDTEAELNKQQ